MKIDAYASRSHYLDHVLGVWRELADDERGTLWVSSRHLVERVADATGGMEARHGIPNTDRSPPVIVASTNDLWEMSGARPAIYLEHGAGQTYPGDKRTADHNSYSGGGRRRRVDLFLCPNGDVADRERAANPTARVAIVGSPRLDAAFRAARKPLHMGGRRVLGITWHWDCYLIPETRSAWPAWKAMLRRIVDVWPGPVIGHAHPRLFSQVALRYEHAGIQPVADVDTFLAFADVVTFDNTSVGYDAAALGIPVVALNAPWYRKDVEHGLRFWEHVPGPELDPTGDGDDDARSIVDAALLASTKPWRWYGNQIAALVYPTETWGKAGATAADAIREVFG